MIVLFAMVIGAILPNEHTRKDWIESARVALAELVVEIIFIGIPLYMHYGDKLLVP